MSSTLITPPPLQAAPRPPLRTPVQREVRLNRDVFFAADADQGSLLDFRRSQFIGLNLTATGMLRLILDHGLQRGVELAAGRYAAPVEQLHQDAVRLIDQLAARELVVAETGERRKRNRSAFRFLRRLPAAIAGGIFGTIAGGALRLLHRRLRRKARAGKQPLGRFAARLVLGCFWLHLRSHGWTRSVELVRALHARQAVASADRPELLSSLDRIIQETAVRCWLLPMACKERAMAAFFVLRSVCGLSPRLVVGIERYPFRAHAWTECDGVVVSDAAEHCEAYTPAAVFE